jgi:hypothetical protein
VFSQTADTFAAFQAPFADYLDALAEFVDDRADEALAAALAGDLPPLTGQAGRFLRVNAAGTAVAMDIGVAGRNRIINGQGRINQRGYVSGAATTIANQYTLDRWRVVTSGQSLAFTGTDAGRTMTAPAGGCEQVIEGVNIEGGTYVINWTGTATCTVDGTPRAKGATFTLTANTNATVRMVGGTFTDVQLELGTVATPFDRLDFRQELRNCQPYFVRWAGEAGAAGFVGVGTGVVNSGTEFLCFIPLQVGMRVTPALSFTGTVRVSDGTATPLITAIVSTYKVGANGVWANFTVTAGLTAGRAAFLYTVNTASDSFAADAEL